VLSILEGTEKLTGQKGIYASAAWDSKSKEIIVKIVNITDKALKHNIQLSGGKKLDAMGTITVLKSQDLNAVNSFDAANIKPSDEKIAVKGKAVNISLAPYSLSVLKIKTR
jgi:alpha-L-arabinofuranosidase